MPGAGDDHLTGPGPRWGLGDAVAGFAVGLLLSVLGVVLFAEPTAAGTQPRITVALIVASAVGLWVGLAGAAVRASYLKGTRSLARDFGLATTAGDLGLGLGAGVLTQILLVPLLYLPLSRFVDLDQLDEPARQITGSGRGAGLALIGVVLVVGAPVVEELFFRGLLLRALARRFGERRAVVGSALAFGLSHFEGLQLLALFVFGLVLGGLAVRRGRLGPAIWAHVAFNAVTFIALVAST